MYVRTDLAWAAGFFDADGCFSRSGSVRVANMAQVTVEPLDIFAMTTGIGTIKGPFEKSTATINRQPQWIYYCYGEDARLLYGLLVPWLGTYRRDQGAQALGAHVPEHLPAFESLPKAEQLAWAGGFFDGEGCFSWSPPNGSVKATITNTDNELLKRFLLAVGAGKIYGPYDPHSTSFGKKPSFAYAVHGFERVQSVFATLWPYIGSRKRLQAMAIFESYLTCWPCGCPRGPTWQRCCPARSKKPGPKPRFKRKKLGM